MGHISNKNSLKKSIVYQRIYNLKSVYSPQYNYRNIIALKWICLWFGFCRYTERIIFSSVIHTHKRLKISEWDNRITNLWKCNKKNIFIVCSKTISIYTIYILIDKLVKFSRTSNSNHSNVNFSAHVTSIYKCLNSFVIIKRKSNLAWFSAFFIKCFVDPNLIYYLKTATKPTNSYY